MLALVLLTGCYRRGTQPPPTPPTQERVAIAAGDVLQVEVFGEKDLTGKFQVSDQGTIDYPLVGRVHVTGKSPPEVASLLRDKLADGYLRRPYVAVFAEGYTSKRKIYVWGQVQKTGTFSYATNMTLIEALTLAGGLTPMADKNGLTLTRVVEGKKQTYSLPMGDGQSASYQVKPGDVIFVPERVF